MTIAGIPLVIFAITLGFTIAIGAIIYSLIPVQSEVAKRLKRAEAMSFQQGSRRSDAFAKIFSEKQRGKLAVKLQEAGMYTVSPAQMGVRMLACGGVGLLMGLAFAAAMNDFSLMYIMWTVILAAVGAYLPFSRLGGAAKKRKAAIQRALPDFLDMLASTVQAGLGFNAAWTWPPGLWAKRSKPRFRKCAWDARKRMRCAAWPIASNKSSSRPSSRRSFKPNGWVRIWRRSSTNSPKKSVIGA
jgi:hypothetical protein